MPFALFVIRCNEKEKFCGRTGGIIVTEERKRPWRAIEARKGLVCDVADHIWEYAELSLQEFKSAALYREVLEKEGFRVERSASAA